MARDLKLGLNTGYWSAAPPAGIEATIGEAERLGFDSVWTQAPVTAAGPHYPLPYPDGTGLGKPLKSTLHPLRIAGDAPSGRRAGARWVRKEPCISRTE